MVLTTMSETKVKAKIAISLDLYLLTIMELLHLHWGDFAFSFSDWSHHSIPILAQTFDDIDIIADMEEAWYNFVETGQCWALLIGLIVGYGFKGLTNY